MMDVLDEINGKIEELCAIAERERERALDRLIHNANLLVEYGPEDAHSRGEVAQLALDYASWTHSLDGYRALLRRGDAPIARVK